MFSTKIDPSKIDHLICKPDDEKNFIEATSDFMCADVAKLTYNYQKDKTNARVFYTSTDTTIRSAYCFGDILILVNNIISVQPKIYRKNKDSLIQIHSDHADMVFDKFIPFEYDGEIYAYIETGLCILRFFDNKTYRCDLITQKGLIEDKKVYESTMVIKDIALLINHNDLYTNSLEGYVKDHVLHPTPMIDVEPNKTQFFENYLREHPECVYQTKMSYNRTGKAIDLFIFRYKENFYRLASYSIINYNNYYMTPINAFFSDNHIYTKPIEQEKYISIEMKVDCFNCYQLSDDLIAVFYRNGNVFSLKIYELF